jgi:hypothetical protein
MYGHPSSLKRGLLTPTVVCVHFGKGYPRVLALQAINFLSDDHVKSASSIYQQLAVASSSEASAQAACSCKAYITK